MAQTPNGIVVSDDSSNANDVDDTSSTSMPLTPQPPSREEQYKAIDATFIARLEIGSTVYVVPAKWVKTFKQWARGLQQQKPGPCDPVPQLCDQDGVVKAGLVEDADYYFTTEEGWSIIKAW
jgi:hypothetical protein